MLTKKQVCAQNYQQDGLSHHQIRNIQDHFSIARLIESIHDYTRISVSLNKNLSLAHELKLTKDDCYFVRVNLAQDSRNKEVLETLIRDKDRLVALKARVSLRKLGEV